MMYGVMPKGIMINSEHYCAKLDKVSAVEEMELTGRRKGRVILQQGNVCRLQI